jgi:hypothetical protein
VARSVLTVLLALTIALALAGSSSAKKYKSTYKASPAYPESTLAMSVRGKPRAGGIATLRVTGSNASREDANGLAFNYTLDVYVMDRTVFRSCAPSLSENATRISNLPAKVEWIGLSLDLPASGPFQQTIRYRTERFRRLLFCAYTTYVVDTAAVGTLKHDLRKARRRR